VEEPVPQRADARLTGVGEIGTGAADGGTRVALGAALAVENRAETVFERLDLEEFGPPGVEGGPLRGGQTGKGTGLIRALRLRTASPSADEEEDHTGSHRGSQQNSRAHLAVPSFLSGADVTLPRLGRGNCKEKVRTGKHACGREVETCAGNG